MKFHRASAFGSVILVSLLFSTRAPGQEKKPLTFGTEVNLVAVPVLVTDKDGKTVAGLTAQDFEVEDGGKMTPVEGFLAVLGDGDLGLPVDAVSNLAQLTSRRQFVLLFDLALSRAVAIERSRVAARKFVETEVRPRDLISVVAATPQGMKILLGLSPDRVQVIQAINAVGRGDVGRNRDPLGIIFDTGVDSTIGVASDLEGKQQLAAEDSREKAFMMMRQQRQAYAQQIGQFLGGFQALARQLDAIRGRKNVILFSEGFDASIVSGTQGGERAVTSTAVTTGALWEVDGDAYFGSASGAGALTNLFATMRGSDVVVHAIDLGSAGTDTMNLSSQEGSPFTASTVDSLASFAANTGGRFMKGVSDVGSALSDISNATRDYYVLAFAPTSSEVGKLRKLKIKVKKPGLRVNHRPAYFVPDPKKPDVSRQALQASEIIAKGMSGGSILLSAYALPYRSPQAGIGLPVVIQIPPEAFTEALKRKQINMELFGYLVDDKGTVRDFFKTTPSLDPLALAAKLKASGLQILTTFAAGAGDFEVRLLLRDTESPKFGALRIPVTVPAFPAAVFVSSPMVTDDPFARVALPTVTERRPGREIPFRIGDRPFTVEAAPVLKRGSAREICVFKTPSTGDAKDMKVVLIGADGTEKAQPFESLTVGRDADGFDRVVFTISAKDVEAGDYGLRVNLGAAASTVSRLRVQ
jgi:VWFA-related protein